MDQPAIVPSLMRTRTRSAMGWSAIMKPPREDLPVSSAALAIRSALERVEASAFRRAACLPARSAAIDHFAGATSRQRIVDHIEFRIGDEILVGRMPRGYVSVANGLRTLRIARRNRDHLASGTFSAALIKASGAIAPRENSKPDRRCAASQGLLTFLLGE